MLSKFCMFTAFSYCDKIYITVVGRIFFLRPYIYQASTGNKENSWGEKFSKKKFYKNAKKHKTKAS